MWSAPATSDKDRKRLLRTLLADITITPVAGDRAQLLAGLRWKSGASQQIPVTRRKNAAEQRVTDPDALAFARKTGPSCDNIALAAALNQAGYRTGTGRPFDVTAATNLRHYYQIPFPRLLEDGELTPKQVAGRVGVSVTTVHAWINDGHLPARRGPARRWAIPFPPATEEACRQRAAATRREPPADTDPRPRRNDEYTPAEVAARLSVSPDVIHNWARRGHIPARHGPGRRLLIRFTPATEQACLTRIASSRKLPAHIRTQAAQRMERNAV